jgi:uncharacterized protein YjlB
MATDAQSLHFERSEGIPNNPQLPVVLRLGVQDIVSDPDACERLFARNGWVGSWRDGVFPFHHFHSNAHEVLGLVQGEVTIMLGGPADRSCGSPRGMSSCCRRVPGISARRRATTCS